MGSNPGHGLMHCSSSYCVAASYIQNRGRLATDVSSGPNFLTKPNKTQQKGKSFGATKHKKLYTKSTGNVNTNKNKWGCLPYVTPISRITVPSAGTDLALMREIKVAGKTSISSSQGRKVMLLLYSSGILIEKSRAKQNLKIAFILFQVMFPQGSLLNNRVLKISLPTVPKVCNYL